jgi:hypothetical protein
MFTHGMGIWLSFVIISLIKILKLSRDQKVQFLVAFCLRCPTWLLIWKKGGGGVYISKYPNFNMFLKIIEVTLNEHQEIEETWKFLFLVLL